MTACKELISVKGAFGYFTVEATFLHSHTKYYGWYYAIFAISFWLSKFYLMQFNPNWRLIISDFLVKGEVERRGTRMKRAQNMSVMLKVPRKIHFGPLTLKII